MVKNIFNQKKFGIKKFCFQKTISQKNLLPKNFPPKNIFVQKILVQNNGPQQNVRLILVLKKFWSKRICQKKFPTESIRKKVASYILKQITDSESQTATINCKCTQYQNLTNLYLLVVYLKFVFYCIEIRPKFDSM